MAVTTWNTSIPLFHILLEILNKHAPMKKKYIIANQISFMTKELSKAIM